MRLEREPKRGYGFIYILSNVSMPDIHKVGLTTNSIKQRIQNLSSPSGVPTPYEVVRIFEIEEGYLYEVEQLSHKKLKSKGFHHAKEYFKCNMMECAKAVEASIFKITDHRSTELIGHAKGRAEYEKLIKENEDKERRDDADRTEKYKNWKRLKGGEEKQKAQLLESAKHWEWLRIQELRTQYRQRKLELLDREEAKMDWFEKLMWSTKKRHERAIRIDEEAKLRYPLKD